ncbi:FAD/FMN-dependent dehydrogenase [Idiomarina sp. A28L]|uniref:D-2-hydroxyglutarate dehydrogenase YdiJ n=1 Tax=Idiomarina sp. A28L TaxID=1036674 RepID=UPI0002138A09|nr:FAD-binding and (Fe-S)-binding domain-containing protein [Idiomarina sp. A28L]EGN75832.1 FAD/FMN-dependent dehydrogenase [Idiomarina sp. A28L]
MTNRLPVLNDYEQVPEETQAYLSALEQAGYIGEVDFSYSGRMVAATDNSIYQQLPQAVLYPRSQNDVRCIFRTAARAQFQGIKFSPRGGGTGTNGQALTPGVVVDLSRHLTRVLELNVEEGWVRVESGIVKDQLNAVLAPHGFFFAPDTSTSNRCTLGGMIATDASGQGSLIYGKTSDHVLALRSVLVSGDELRTEPVSLAEAERIAKTNDVIGHIYQQVLRSCKDMRSAIEDKFPPLNRFLTGYDLAHAYDPENETIDVGRLIAGAEGTLSIVTEAKLKITPTPNFKVLVNVKYQDFEDALRHAPELVKARATSVETVDSTVLDLARNDIIWHQVKDLLTDVPPYRMGGINILEFTGIDQAEIGNKLKALCNQLAGLDPQTTGVIGYQICREESSIQKIYAMRKKAVGLLGATKGNAKPVAFVEDTAVPPERLAEYIMEFRALLDSHQLKYGMFGHVDAGVLHVRPALDMQNPESSKMVRTISDQVMRLTARYGGLMWGEHGKGYRSEYGPEFFGEALFTELRKIKAAFDPLNRLNPGKICTPWQSKEPLVSVDAKKRGWFDRQIPLTSQEQFQGVMDCNGNGLCFNFDVTSPMCPSYRATGDRRYSPKGRATLLREWLRRLAAVDYSTVTSTLVEKSVFANFRLSKAANSDDFTQEVKQALDTCLSCKACSSQCPVKVDIPSQRAIFYAHYHQKFKRPLKDYLVLSTELNLLKLARFPRVGNFLASNPLSKVLQKHWIGYVDTPKFSVPSLAKQVAKHNYMSIADVRVKAESLAFDANDYVFVVQDAFTSAFDAHLVNDFMQLVRLMGKEPILLPYMANAKAAHVKGFLNSFERIATSTAERLAALQQEFGVPMVGLDAATVLCFRDEFRKEGIPNSEDFTVLLAHEWLHKNRKMLATLVAEKQVPENMKTAQVLAHCTEQTALPNTGKAWHDIFAAAGVKAESPAVGCCGMAGTFGHELENQEISRTIFDLSWQKFFSSEELSNKENTAEASQKAVLATGFSCRCQAARYTPEKPRHPIQQLLAWVG